MKIVSTSVVLCMYTHTDFVGDLQELIVIQERYFNVPMSKKSIYRYPFVCG